jgi:hypothetical protein
MNDLQYYNPLVEVIEAGPSYRNASTQVRFGYQTFANAFHWNLRKLLGDISPSYFLAPPEKNSTTHLQLPFLDDSLKLHVNVEGIAVDDWLEHATATFLAEVHADCLDSLVVAKSADLASTMLSNVGHTVVIRVLREALRLSHRRTVDPGVLEEAISTLCLLSRRRYEGRIPELGVCFGATVRRPKRQEPKVYFGRDFLGSKKSAVLLKGGTFLLDCLANGRVVDVVDLDFANSGPLSERVLGPLGSGSTLNYSFNHGAITVMLTQHGEVLVAMGARICFSWDGGNWRVYPAKRLNDRLCAELQTICNPNRKALPEQLAHYLSTTALTLREDGLGALLVVSRSEQVISNLILNKQMNVSPVEDMYSKLFVGRPLSSLSPKLACNAAALDGAIVVDGNGIIRGIGCIFEPKKVKTAAEGARTRAAIFASTDGVALKVSQDGEMSIYTNGKNRAIIFSPIG